MIMRTILGVYLYKNNSKYFFFLPRYSSNVCSTQHSQQLTETYSGHNVLQKVDSDLSTVAPYLSNTFNLAAYVNNSQILQNFINLNVNLSKIEKKPFIAEKLLKLNFDAIKNHILFIKDHAGIDNIGSFITVNPMIFFEPLEDLKVRINYLQSKRFHDDQINRIITKNPFWIMFSTKRIDRRLGHFQDKFKLTGSELRMLASKQPKLITYNLHHVKTNSFVIKEEMGFEDNEIKCLLLDKPKLWMIDQKSLLHRFNYIHNTIKIPHTQILNNPGILLCRNFRIKQRHLFLEKLGRAQYDPKKENYVPIIALAENTDIEFCKAFAKCSVSDFNTFLKTL
ncbi:transcription termination factor 3, mitochondrial [Plodia interpunctella]|uniref:transcription termination factor 3, mitochondrial n=1 Tax=Plodia interpunctella TaxID=58824 RepID=UPI0023682609|nr:transcription termination factor 3, mitochondrial [Plodia interpunctella]